MDSFFRTGRGAEAGFSTGGAEAAGAEDAALALGFSAALAFASCGEDAELLPGATAREITENLDTVQQLADEGDCAGAAAAAEEVSAQVAALDGVDPKLKRGLESGAARLNEVIVTCEETTTEAVAPPVEETETEETEPPGQEKKEEKEREKEEREQEKDEGKADDGEDEETAEPPTTEPPTTTPPPSEDGGTGAPGGVSPAAPAEPEDGDE